MVKNFQIVVIGASGFVAKNLRKHLSTKNVKIHLDDDMIICMKRDDAAILITIFLTALLGGGGIWLSELPVHDEEVGSVRVAVVQAIPKEARESAPEPTQVEVPILIYHTIRPWYVDDGPDARAYNVTPETFRKQMAYLAKSGYASITFDDLRKAMFFGELLPEKPILITLDDGTSSHHQYAFPVLREYGLKATFFIFTNAIDRPNYLTSEQILEMRSEGMRFGNHTRYHQYLTRLPIKEMHDEIRVGKERLEELLEEKIDVIAYPFGLHNEVVEQEAREIGHSFGRTIKEGRVHHPDEPMKLPGYQINDSLARLRYALGE